MTMENDLVLIYLEDRPAVYARIENIAPDHKPGWYHVTLFLLQVPHQIVTWILRDAYINGDGFTMEGKRMRLEKVPPPKSFQPVAAVEPPPPPARTQAKIVSFADLKKK